MSIVRFGRVVPGSLREWDRVFEPLNNIILQNSETTTIVVDQVVAPNLPAADSAFLTLSPNDSLTNERVLTPVPGELVTTDYGAGNALAVGLAAVGTPGSYAKVVVDAKGRVSGGASLADADIPATIARKDEVTAQINTVASNVIALQDRLKWGAGSPEGAVIGTVGTLYLRTDGGAGTTLYVKESGSGLTGWVPK
jgi:hypothetical protein